MSDSTYLEWLLANTRTEWWHDSADPPELRLALERGAVGVTTNPLLSSVTMARRRPEWAAAMADVDARGLIGEPKAEALIGAVASHAAAMYAPHHERTSGRTGFVCAQVNPSRAGDREAMLAMARRYHALAPNIAVKLPAVAAGLDVLEDCIAEGITATATVSFTVPQAIAIAERCRAGRRRALDRGIEPGRCFAVIMIGRVDDYLREVAQDSRAAATESDIRQAGLAVTKRAYRIYQERDYEAVLLVAALRGPYHLTDLAGAQLVMSMAPAPQEWFVTQDWPREERIGREIDADVVARLSTMPEFVKAYAPDGMSPEEFLAYGLTQRTLSQFVEAGWKPLEEIR